MNIFSSLVQPASFQIGFRALSRRTGRFVLNTAVRQCAASRPNAQLQICCYHGQLGVPNPSRTWKNTRSPLPKHLPRTSIRTAKFRAVIRYLELPEAYDDALGLEFRKEALSQREVTDVFGDGIEAQAANRLLKIIQGRRVAGTLDDPDLQENTVHYRAADKIKALEYLRKHIPVDEVINAGLRAEDELRIIEEREQAQQDAEQQLKETSKQSSPSNLESTKPQHPTGRLPLMPKHDSPYGESTFDRIRRQNIALREAEEKAKEEARLQREAEEAASNIGTLQTEQAQPRELSPWRQKYADKATSDLVAPPEMKAWERILPMAAMTVLVTAGCVALAVFYKPSKRDGRLWPDVPPAAATCAALILLNLIVYGLWKFPPAWAVLNRYMIVIAATPHPFQLIGATFSHQSFNHLAGNMIALWFFGVRLHDEIGRGNFLALYFSSGALGFLASVSHLVLFRGLTYTTLGASAAIYGVIAGYFWLHKYDEFKVFGYPPDPLSGPQGLAFLGVIIGLHIFASFSKGARAELIDIPSHAGGMFGGILGVDLIKKRIDETARIRAEKFKSMNRLNMVINKTNSPTKPAGS